MGRSPCCRSEDGHIKKGPWSPEEDVLLVDYVRKNGTGNWQTLPKKAGLNRCGKSCRLRWTNYLRPDIKRGPFSNEEEAVIINLHQESGNKWSRIAAYLPGRTDNEIKNYWNTHLRKKLIKSGIDPETHREISDLDRLRQLLSNSNLSNLITPLINSHGNSKFVFLQSLQNLIQLINSSPLQYLQAASQLNSLISNGVNTEFTGGNFFHPHTELGNFTPPTSNPFLRVPTFSETNLGSAQVAPTESNSYFKEGLTQNSFNVAPHAGTLSTSIYLQYCEGELSPQGVLGNNIIDNSLPTLVSASPESSMVNPILESLKQGYNIPTEAFESDFFDTLDNFLDDEASSSFLKDIMG